MIQSTDVDQAITRFSHVIVKVLDVEFQCSGVIHHDSRCDIPMMYSITVDDNMQDLEEVLKPEVVGEIRRVLLSRYRQGGDNGSV